MSKKTTEEILKDADKKWAKLSKEERMKKFREADKRAAKILGDE